MISRTPAPGRSAQARWTAVVAGGVVVLSFEGTIVRSLDLDQWTILLLRGPLMAAGLALLFGLGRRGGGPLAGLRAAGRLGLGAAGLFAADNLLFIIALRNSSVANTLVLLATAPVFAGVLGRLVLGERPPARTWAATVVVLLGVGVIVSGGLGHSHLLGDLAALGAALSIAGTLVLIRLGRAVVMWPSMALGALGASLVAAPLADAGSVGARDGLLLVLVGLVVAPLAFGAISVGPRHLPAQEVSLLMLLETVLGPLWAWLLLGQAPAAATIGGGALIVAALLAHALLGMRRPPPAVVERPPV
jgi:drug/metabolite transporter (DMT)-like permease